LSSVRLPIILNGTGVRLTHFTYCNIHEKFWNKSTPGLNFCTAVRFLSIAWALHLCLVSSIVIVLTNFFSLIPLFPRISRSLLSDGRHLVRAISPNRWPPHTLEKPETLYVDPGDRLRTHEPCRNRRHAG
jgi:hypothetical protein